MKWLSTTAAAFLVAGCVTVPPPRSLPPGASFTDCRGCPEMVVVPVLELPDGLSAEEGRRDPDEGPQKIVRFERPFAIAKYPVTRAQYARFAVATRRPPGDSCYAEQNHSGRWGVEQGLDWRNVGYPQSDRDPVVCVNFDDLRAYVSWVNMRSGGGYRLISQAEYEYGQRAGSTGRFAGGEPMTHEQANFGTDPCCHGLVEGHDRWLYTSPVGSFPANAFGLADMQGNVWEFTEDCYDDSLASIPPDGRAVVTATCEKRVIRGAGWDDPPYYLRSANRYKQFANLRGSVTGFRLVKVID